jgi:kynurenine formamidase
MKLSTIVEPIAHPSSSVACLLARADEPSLWSIHKILVSKRFVDLTHAFEPGIPSWPGFPDEKRERLNWNRNGRGKTGDGFFAETFTHVGQWGTHVDPPAHFARGVPNLRTVDEISLKEMILPLVVIDVHEEAAKNPDYALSLERIEKWETEHGAIPPGAFVALRTDWSKRWPDNAAMQNKDANGISHYPGWSLTALKYLYEERKITASGHETTDTEPGIAASNDDYSLESYILGSNHYQIELLTNLDQVPEAGALVVVSFPKPKGGSGFPARIFAILPDWHTPSTETSHANTMNALEIVKLANKSRFRLARIHSNDGFKSETDCKMPSNSREAMKRFSVKVFLLVTLLHIFGTILLMDAHFTLKQAMQTGQPEESFLWLYISSWIWHPVPRLLSSYLGPLAPSSVLHYTFAWSLCVGACFGFLVPRLSRWRRGIS